MPALGPPNPLLSIYSREIMELDYKETHTKMFIVSVLVIVTNYNQPNSSRGDWIYKPAILHNG